MPNGCPCEGALGISEDKVDEFKACFDNIDFDSLNSTYGEAFTLIGYIPELKVKGKVIHTSVRGSVDVGDPRPPKDGFIMVDFAYSVAGGPTDLQEFLEFFKAVIDPDFYGELFFEEPGMGFAGVLQPDGEECIEYEDLPLHCPTHEHEKDNDDFDPGDHECCTKHRSKEMMKAQMALVVGRD